MTGTVSPLYEPAVLLQKAGVVLGHDMTSEAALTKLSYLFAHSELCSAEITRRFCQPLRGELTEHARMVFSHPCSVMPDHISQLTALGYAIANGNLSEVQETMKGEVQWQLNQGDYSGNTPLVSSSSCHNACFINIFQHIAATSSPIEILRFLLTKGASVHIRNKAGRTPLFLAANAGLMDHVALLVKSGAHFHAEEQIDPIVSAFRKTSAWRKIVA